MKKTIATLTCTVMIIGLWASQAAAGAARRHTLEGFALGTGVALLGAVIYHEIHRDGERREPAPVYRDRHRKDKRDRGHGYHADRKRHRKHFKGHRGRGHWEAEKRWVPPVYEKKWNPGHYNRRGKWISGHYQKFLVREGYYKRVKIWVRH